MIFLRPSVWGVWALTTGVIMALVLPKDFDGPAWDACGQFLRQFHEKANEVFKAMHQPEFGFVVAHWQSETAKIPTHYLRRVGHSSPAYVLLDNFVGFGVGIEDPFRPKTFSAAENLVKVAKKKFELKFGLIFWTKPGFDFVPSKYYRVMIGEQLAGSAKK